MNEKAISIVRPSEPELKVNWILQVYFSKVHHEAWGGPGDIDWLSVFGEPNHDSSPGLDVSFRKSKKGWKCVLVTDGKAISSDHCPTRLAAMDSLASKPGGEVLLNRGRSDRSYYASFDKYDAKTSNDVRVLYCQCMMQQALKEIPDVVKAYLAWKWPTKGVYRPSVRKYRLFDVKFKRWFYAVPDGEDPAGSFVEAGTALGLPGFSGTDKDVKWFKKYLRRKENVVKSRLREMLEREAATNKPLAASESVTA